MFTVINIVTISSLRPPLSLFYIVKFGNSKLVPFYSARFKLAKRCSEDARRDEERDFGGTRQSWLMSLLTMGDPLSAGERCIEREQNTSHSTPKVCTILQFYLPRIKWPSSQVAPFIRLSTSLNVFLPSSALTFVLSPKPIRPYPNFSTSILIIAPIQSSTIMSSLFGKSQTRS